MARKLTLSQYRSQLRRIKNKRKQAINKYKQDVRQRNQKIRRAVNAYNSEVRKYNVRVRANRQRIISELNRLRSRTNIRYKVLRTSTLTLHNAYQALDSRENEFLDLSQGSEFLDLSERENANSLAASNALDADDEHASEAESSLLASSKIANELSSISLDLDNRWKGALFSLNPNNPDAARHFCTSAREIFIQMLDIHAPDREVLTRFPSCERTDKGFPTRKWKIRHILAKGGIVSDQAVNFVDEDVSNILQLFGVFNLGTHGSSGQLDFKKLLALKERVEDGIGYLSTICNYS